MTTTRRRPSSTRWSPPGTSSAAAPAERRAQGAGPGRGPILEIGAGTGRVTEVIAAALPTAEIVAMEPSPPMRAILTSRVADDPGLRERVTVVDTAAPDLPPLDRISAAVIFGVAGHLTEPERRTLWARLRERLAPGGVIVVELMGVRTPRTIPPTLSLRETMGRQVYEWWLAGEPLGPGLMRFTTTWRVLRDGRTVREVSDGYDWHTLDTAQIAREAGMTSRRIAHAGGEVTPRSRC
ncbi:class I SAM-dependent methyltransferase [Thermocatellispora tengchongensis]|uniref:class I SAM-dependent methyltransferase n=1 Tax=Thermocatellispora tengchongensis TaxID=1073253 RepID=UPI003633F4F2